MATPEDLAVPVVGGTLAVCRWPGSPDAPTVLAAHGITANGMSFAKVAEALDGRVTLLAPDLRGRARSAGLPGPYGLAAHADDLVAVLDHLGLDRAVVAGHSMGGFVAAVAAVRHPERVAGVLLIDGGVALRVPEGADIDAILEAVIGPAMTRLSMTFESRQAYLGFFRGHPALAEHWSSAVEDYVLRDVTGEPPALRSSCAIDAIRRDATDTLLDEDTVTAVHRMSCPATLVWAGHGLLNEPQGLYDDALLDGVGLDRQRVTVDSLPDLNHYTIVLADEGASAIARHIERLVDPTLIRG